MLADLTDGQVAQVTGIAFEHSPGRGNPAFTGDASAFDVYVEYATPAGDAGFLGIEVKYHENLQNPAARHRHRYDEVASAMGCFRDDACDALRAKPLQQIWRDHLLAGSLRQHDRRFAEGRFAFLSPTANPHCAQAVAAYQQSLTSTDTFLPWTLEQVHAALQRQTDAAWVQQFAARYLDFAALE